ncbi:hypothetical protein SHIRM173S_00546 [Streptomyces hirsutus]
MASRSLVIAATRSLTRPASFSQPGRPRRSSSARLITQSSVSTPSMLSMTTTWPMWGSSARFATALATCSAFSAISTRLSESDRM